jgi:hypothetical protein
VTTRTTLPATTIHAETKMGPTYRVLCREGWLRLGAYFKSSCSDRWSVDVWVGSTRTHETATSPEEAQQIILRCHGLSADTELVQGNDLSTPWPCTE